MAQDALMCVGRALGRCRRAVEDGAVARFTLLADGRKTIGKVDACEVMRELIAIGACQVVGIETAPFKTLHEKQTGIADAILLVERLAIVDPDISAGRV